VPKGDYRARDVASTGAEFCSWIFGCYSGSPFAADLPSGGVWTAPVNCGAWPKVALLPEPMDVSPAPT